MHNNLKERQKKIEAKSKQEKNELKSIKKMLQNKNYNLSLIALKEFLNKYPNNIFGKIEYARLMDEIGCIEESLPLFEELYNQDFDVLDIMDQHCICRNLFFDYFKIKKYDKVIEMYPKLVESCKLIHNEDKYNIYYKIALNKLGLLDINDRNKYNYTERQMIYYSKKDAINHISYHTEDNARNEKSIFNADINIELLYNLVLNRIQNAKPIKSTELINVYRFRYDNVGISKEEVSNFIEIISVKDTNNILTIYPTDNSMQSEDLIVNKEKKKVKKISQMEKFKIKYEGRI